MEPCRRTLESEILSLCDSVFVFDEVSNCWRELPILGALVSALATSLGTLSTTVAGLCLCCIIELPSEEF